MARYNDYWASMEENLITVNGVTMTTTQSKGKGKETATNQRD